MSDYKVDDLVLCTEITSKGDGWVEKNRTYKICKPGDDNMAQIKPLIDNKYPNGMIVGSGILMVGNGKFEKL